MKPPPTRTALGEAFASAFAAIPRFECGGGGGSLGFAGVEGLELLEDAPLELGSPSSFET